MRARRAAFLLGLAASVAIGLTLRLSTRGQLMDGARVRALSSDSSYHLRRARFAAAAFPRTVLFDPLMNYPSGGVPIWPPLYDLALAAPARIAHGAEASAAQVERGAAWVPLVFAAGAILLAGVLGLRLFGPTGGVTAALFVACSPGHLLWSQFGHTDQHVAESFFGLLVLLLFLRSRPGGSGDRPGGPRDRVPRRAQGVRGTASRPPRQTHGRRQRRVRPALTSPAEPRGDRQILARRNSRGSRDPGEAGEEAQNRRKLWREVAAGLALGLGVLTWQGAICWGAAVALALFLEALTRRSSVARPLLAILGTAAAVSLAGTAAWLGGRQVPFTYVSFGYFQPLFLAALAGGALLLETVLRAVRGELSARALAARVLGLAGAAALALPFFGELAGGLVAGLGYVMRHTDEAAGPGGFVSYPSAWLKGIFETRPLLSDGLALPLRQLSAALLLTPLAILVWAARAVRGCRPGIHWGLAVWGGVTLFLALSQRLNVYYAAPICALAAVEAARFLSTRLRRRGDRGTSRSPAELRGDLEVPAKRDLLARAKRPRRGAIFAAAAVVLSLPMLLGIRDELAAVHVPGSDLFATLGWMRAELPREVSAYDPRILDASPADPPSRAVSGVIAPWSLGHLILYNAELPVVANNFGYGFLDSIRFFLAESEDQALAIARARRVRWVIATDLVPRMNDYASYLGKPPLLRATESGPRPMPAYFRTVQSRLYDFDGRGGRVGEMDVPPLPSFRLIHQSASAIPRGGRWLARWKVFEVVAP